MAQLASLNIRHLYMRVSLGKQGGIKMCQRLGEAKWTPWALRQSTTLASINESDNIQRRRQYINEVLLYRLIVAELLAGKDHCHVRHRRCGDMFPIYCPRGLT